MSISEYEVVLLGYVNTVLELRITRVNLSWS